VPIEPPPSRWGFPDPATADDDGLVGVGADLEPGTLLAAYRRGLFPMPIHRAGGIGWWSPDPRGVLRPRELKVSRSLRKSAAHLEVRVDTDFRSVVEACAAPDRDGRWITPAIVDAYDELHRAGWAHSVETWQDGRLVGGLYGVAIGGLFAGESMFHLVRDASKVALVGLRDLLIADGDPRRLVDVQWQTPHLATLGVRDVPREEYLATLPTVLSAPLPPCWA
jgi:leucyl/phenylalanyl-tRNA---protein transferase